MASNNQDSPIPRFTLHTARRSKAARNQVAENIEMESNNQDSPLPRLTLHTPGRAKTARNQVAENIEAQGRVAVVPCDRCHRLGILCQVGSTAKRCAACARSGIRLDSCGVDRDNYRELPNDEESESSSDEIPAASGLGEIPMTDSSDDASDTKMPTADAEPAPASVSQSQNASLLIDRKIDWINKKSMDIFHSVGNDIFEMQNKIISLEETVEDLQGRVKALEDMVATLAGEKPSSAS